MKILIASDTYYPHVNGASYFAQRLAYYLHKQDHEVLVVAPSRKMQHELYKHDGVSVLGLRSFPIFLYKGSILPTTLHIYRYKNFRLSLSPLEKKVLEKALLDFQPDIIHLQNHFLIGRTVLNLAKKHRYPIVGTNHFMPENLIHYAPLPKRVTNKVKSWVWKDFRNVYEQCDTITTPTQSAANLIKQIGFSKPIIPVSCGIDRKRFSPNNNGKYLRKKYKIPSRKILLYVGRLDKEKNLDVILYALTLVPENVQAHLVIAGTGAQSEYLKSLVSEYQIKERVTFTGFVSNKDLPNLYSLASCFIIAGTAELQSIVTMEAMASGLPVLAVDAVALPELVHHKKNGFLFHIDDPKTAARHIETIFNNEVLRKKMSKESLRIIEKHDIGRVINKFEEIYSEAIKQK